MENNLKSKKIKSFPGIAPLLAPSILAADFMKLGTQIEALKDNGVHYVHFDVMDGHFVPSISFGVPVLSSVRKDPDLFIDAHLMIENPDKYISVFADGGADLITIHAEASNDLFSDIAHIHECGCLAGLSIKPGTPVTDVLPYIDDLDLILVMTVEPGFGGQAYIEESDQRIREIRKIRDEAGVSCLIQVDGGIKAENVDRVLKAGAEVIVAGTAVFGEDIAGNINKFNEAFKKFCD
ncbi:MAG: ribulose-phosphate 3-epimerase [Lachnospiraceae bacterium]|nr:ribulose-phosphate 3-epimerase [Lachnospiraceae bacterium]